MSMNLMRWLPLCIFLMAGAIRCAGQEQADTDAKAPPAPPAATEMMIPDALAAAERLYKEQRYNAAIEMLNGVLTRDRGNLDALRLLGDVYWDVQDAENARKNWLLVRAVEPSDFGANFGLGRLQLRSGVFRNAKHYLEVADSVAPPERALEVAIALAKAERGAGDRAKALETISRALALDPENFEAVHTQVMLLAESAQDDEGLDRALTEAERLVQIAGKMLEAEGTTLTGVQRLQLAYDTELTVLSSYGQVLFERNPDGSLSQRLLSGKDEIAANTISRTVDIMLRQADLQRTLTYFQILTLAEKAVEYDRGTNPRTLLELGTLQMAVGKLKNAAATLRKVLELDPENKTARRQLESLQAPSPTSQGSGEPSPAPQPE
jgi:tetratricopeptide (TPR) repeat protein